MVIKKTVVFLSLFATTALLAVDTKKEIEGASETEQQLTLLQAFQELTEATVAAEEVERLNQELIQGRQDLLQRGDLSSTEENALQRELQTVMLRHQRIQQALAQMRYAMQLLEQQPR